jgi:flagellar biosynthetic protein FlhB
MADEASQDQKTEEPTPRRLEKALEEGQIAFSSELLSGLTCWLASCFFWYSAPVYVSAERHSERKADIL